MKQIVTQGIVLSRTDYGEADRIVTLLTPDHGKLRLMARGVRKVKSKLAGGIELFSVSDITFMPGRGEVGTLISTRLQTHYGAITKNIDRVQLGYDLIKLLNKVTEDEPEKEYFALMQSAFVALDDAAIDRDLILNWFQSQLLKLAGHSPNLHTDTNGRPLNADSKYDFDFDAMAFAPAHRGRQSAGHIKALRLLFSANPPAKLARIDGLQDLLKTIVPLITSMLRNHIHL